MFSRGKEVISFPAFVCVWMWATLFQQYSLVSTTLSILTKIYNLSVPCYSRWSHKNRNFLNWFDSPHPVSAFFFFSIFSLSLTRFLPSQNIPCRVIVRRENTLQSKCQQYIWNDKLNVMKTLPVLEDVTLKCEKGVSKKYLHTEGAFTSFM